MVKGRNHRQLNSGFKSSCEVSVDHRLCGDKKGKSQKPRWCEAEDIQLIDYVKINGPQKWAKIASKLKRTSKSCRLRWFNQLSPDISDAPFTAKEDDIIIDMVHTIGGKWARIARALKGRTDNQIKNRWHIKLENVHGQKALQQAPKRKLNQTAEQNQKPTLGNLNGSCTSWPSSVSAPLSALTSASIGSVDLASPAASPSVTCPAACSIDSYLPPAACSIDSYLPPAYVAPYHAANQMDLLNSVCSVSVSAPASAFDWHTSISECPGLETLDFIYEALLFPGNFTAVMQEIIGSDAKDLNWAIGLAESN